MNKVFISIITLFLLLGCETKNNESFITTKTAFSKSVKSIRCYYDDGSNVSITASSPYLLTVMTDDAKTNIYDPSVEVTTIVNTRQCVYWAE